MVSEAIATSTNYFEGIFLFSFAIIHKTKQGNEMKKATLLLIVSLWSSLAFASQTPVQVGDHIDELNDKKNSKKLLRFGTGNSFALDVKPNRRRPPPPTTVPIPATGPTPPTTGPTPPPPKPASLPFSPFELRAPGGPRTAAAVGSTTQTTSSNKSWTWTRYYVYQKSGLFPGRWVNVKSTLRGHCGSIKTVSAPFGFYGDVASMGGSLCGQRLKGDVYRGISIHIGRDGY